VRQYIQEQFQVLLSSRTCLNYLHRLGFVVKRPKKRLCKANAEKRAAFVKEYTALRAEAQLSGAKIFFVDEAHFRAEVELRSQWVLRGEPARRKYPCITSFHIRILKPTNVECRCYSCLFSKQN
jgi:hypothetical protein